VKCPHTSLPIRKKTFAKSSRLLQESQNVEKFPQDITDEKNPVVSFDVRAKCTDKGVGFINVGSSQ
jgi:hypothetical protein